jgi:hypothetical protein
VPIEDSYDDQQEVTEGHSSFDAFTRALAQSSHSRSKALKLAGTAVLGGAFSFLALPDKAEARRRKKRRRRPTSLPSPPQRTYAFAGSITASDRIQNSRLAQVAPRSTCGSSKNVPGMADFEPRNYDVYELRNGSAAACIIVTLVADPLCNIPNSMLSTTYSPSFNPASIQENYVADIAFPPDSEDPSVYSFSLPPNTSFNVVVNEFSPSAGCASYALVVTGLSLP